jgi:hypothetical protein
MQRSRQNSFQEASQFSEGEQPDISVTELHLIHLRLILPTAPGYSEKYIP